MTRRCSHCSNNGHNSRTCPTRGGGAGGCSGGGGGGGGYGGGGGSGGGVKLFGVRLTDGSIMKKSASMGNLSHYHSSSSAAASPNPSSPSSDPFQEEPVHVPDGYLSDDPNHASCSANRRAERKKGVPWTEEEHRLFLLGLQKLGKGDWRGISRNYVTSRTPTQVASHAQKYFIRQTNASRRKRRSSLFDMVPEMTAELLSLAEEQFLLPPQVVDSSKEQLTTSDQLAVDDDSEKSMPSLDLSLKPDFEPMETTPSEVVEGIKENVTSLPEIPPVVPSFFPALIPIPFAIWPPNIASLEEEKSSEASHHQILRPIPILPKEPVNVDALVGMSQLSLVENGAGATESTRLSLKLSAEHSRQSAFHASTPLHGSGVTEDKNSSFPTV